MFDDLKSRVIECCDSLTQDYGSLLVNNRLSDVVLVVGGQELKAHKAILASRSPVFAAMFEHDCEEKQQNKMNITEMDVEVCGEMLCFVYSGKVKSMEKYALQLLEAADMVISFLHCNFSNYQTN